jgi:hypothetical protein
VRRDHTEVLDAGDRISMLEQQYFFTVEIHHSQTATSLPKADSQDGDATQSQMDTETEASRRINSQPHHNHHTNANDELYTTRAQTPRLRSASPQEPDNGRQQHQQQQLGAKRRRDESPSASKRPRTAFGNADPGISSVLWQATQV